jgi:hypothetical protein
MPLLACCIPLLLDELVEFCIAYLRDHLHPSNCVGLFLYGKQHQCKELAKTAKHFIYEHFEDVVRHEEFLTLSSTDLCSLFKDDKLKVKCETIVYNVRDSIDRNACSIDCPLRLNAGSDAMVST